MDSDSIETTSDDSPNETGRETTFWGRPAGVREVLAVALPLVVSSLSWTVLTFVDRVFLKWDSGDAMSAAFSAGVAWFAVLCFPLGVCSYASTFVSQYFGAGQHEKIGPLTWQAVWVALGFSPLVLATIPLAPWFFTMADHSPRVAAMEISYFQILCWGAPAMLVSQSLSSFFSGQGRTGVVMVVDAIFAAVNMGLDYLWIFGFAVPLTGPLAGWSCPAMGIEGAAWATVASLWLKAITYAWLVTRPANHASFGAVSGIRFDLALLRRLLRFGGPGGLQMLLDVTGFTVFIVLLGRLGEVATEATSMAFSISHLAFMPVYGLSMATSILVGQHLGENRDDLAARATWTTFSISIVYMLVVSALYVGLPDLFLYSFFAGEGAASPAADSDAVYALAVTLLKFVAAYNVLDATLMIFAGAIKGAGDMRFVMIVSLIMALLLALASWLSVEVWQLGVFGCWTVITLWIWIVGVVFLLRFLQGRWRNMRVIDQ